jgi:hypothetical protein
VSAYRYVLSRETGLLEGRGEGLFVMLNPSTADETTDDPTIRRCIGFARSFGWARFRVVNLFAARATNPSDLVAMADTRDIVGPLNDATLESLLSTTKRPVAAWGAAGSTKLRALTNVRVDQLFGTTNAPLAEWRCLGTTKAGAPRHPLYVKADAELVPWDARGWLAGRTR